MTRGPVMLRPCLVDVYRMGLRMTDKACVSRSELYCSGRDRPLSQLLPDLQLYQHGFSAPLVFFQCKPRSAMALTCHRVALNEIKLSSGLATFAPSSGRRKNLARRVRLQSRQRQKRTCGTAWSYRQGAVKSTSETEYRQINVTIIIKQTLIYFKRTNPTAYPFAWDKKCRQPSRIKCLTTYVVRLAWLVRNASLC